jgi:hypothetical protein
MEVWCCVLESLFSSYSLQFCLSLELLVSHTVEDRRHHLNALFHSFFHRVKILSSLSGSISIIFPSHSVVNFALCPVSHICASAG